MSKDHYLPRLIIRNFTDSSGRIFFYSKKDKKIYGPFDHYNQLQEKNFYSKKSISKLKEIFSHIEINPIFQAENLNLDKNIELYLERPIGKILSKIIKDIVNGNSPKVSDEDFSLIKEYFVIQHLRTPMQKRISKEVHDKTLRLPLNIKEIIMKQEHNRNIDLKDYVNKNFSHLNSKQRRTKTNELRKLLKKHLKRDPDFIKNIRNSKETDEIINEEIKKSEKELEKIRTHPDKHSSEILDFKLRNRFSKRIDLDNREIKFLVNNTETQFTLPDTGIMIICWDYGIRKELHIYLPIHPKVLIEFSQDSEKMKYVDENFVKEINYLSKDDSLINVYSSDPKSLLP
jgi:hypothetical protein